MEGEDGEQKEEGKKAKQDDSGIVRPESGFKFSLCYLPFCLHRRLKGMVSIPQLGPVPGGLWHQITGLLKGKKIHRLHMRA